MYGKQKKTLIPGGWVLLFQIGAIPGHRSQEHLFCFRSLGTLYYKRIEKPILISLLDVIKFFENEPLKDAMDTNHASNVIGKKLSFASDQPQTSSTYLDFVIRFVSGLCFGYV